MELDLNLIDFLILGSDLGTNIRESFSFLFCLVIWKGKIITSLSLRHRLESPESKRSFTNYVDMISPFFDHLPPSVQIFYGINVDKK